ncbi:MAG: NUDIX domain-containing protein [Candidatus Woesearchaeota archaeon]
MNKSRIAVKSFVINKKGELLLIKRVKDDLHDPGSWEIPGGRIELGEDPFLGLKRETREETGLEIEILHPLRVHHFTRDDKQKITKITFICRAKTSKVRLSEEHDQYIWADIEKAFSMITPFYRKDLEIYKKYFRSSLSK